MAHEQRDGKKKKFNIVRPIGLQSMDGDHEVIYFMYMQTRECFLSPLCVHFTFTYALCKVTHNQDPTSQARRVKKEQ